MSLDIHTAVQTILVLLTIAIFFSIWQGIASIRQAQIVINQWLHQYNHIRPHHALGMRPPVPEILLEKSQISGPVQGG